MTVAPLPDDATLICPKTGLALVGKPEQLAWRTQKSSYGPLNPPRRPEGSGIDPTGWARWDVAGHRTVYAADSPLGSYVEALAYAYASPLVDVPLDRYFDEYEDGVPYTDDEPTLMDQINKEYDASGKMMWGQIAAGWREGRELYTLRLPPTGWFIDVDSAETLSAIARGLPKRLASMSVPMLSLENIYGQRRAVTTMIAHWLRGRVLYDESQPLGILYRSKYGNEFTCYAIWLHKFDDGEDITAEPTTPIGSIGIECRDPQLQRAARYLNLTVH